MMNNIKSQSIEYWFNAGNKECPTCLSNNIIFLGTLGWRIHYCCEQCGEMFSSIIIKSPG